jgi:hypothetical protein
MDNVDFCFRTKFLIKVLVPFCKDKNSNCSNNKIKPQKIISKLVYLRKGPHCPYYHNGRSHYNRTEFAKVATKTKRRHFYEKCMLKAYIVFVLSWSSTVAGDLYKASSVSNILSALVKQRYVNKNVLRKSMLRNLKSTNRSRSLSTDAHLILKF